MNNRKYEVISVIKVNEGNAKPWLGNLTNFDIYHGLFRHEAHIEPFEIPHSVIENIFFLVAQRFGHKNDGIYVADVHVFENGVQNGGVKLDLCIENNRIVGINHNFCYPRRKARVTQNE